MAPISLLPALLFWSWPSPESCLWLAGLAALATGGQFCHIQALRLQDVTALQPIDFVKLPIIAVMALVLFGEQPSIWALAGGVVVFVRSEEHTSELQSLMRTSYAVFCLKKKHYDTYSINKDVTNTLELHTVQ